MGLRSVFISTLAANCVSMKTLARATVGVLYQMASQDQEWCQQQELWVRPLELGCFLSLAFYSSGMELLQTTMVLLTFTVVPLFLFASDLLALRVERALGDHLWPTSHSLTNSLQSQVAVWPQLAQHQGLELSPDQKTTPLAEGSFHMGGYMVVFVLAIASGGSLNIVLFT